MRLSTFIIIQTEANIKYRNTEFRVQSSEHTRQGRTSQDYSEYTCKAKAT
jgi:hypothetical protein